MNDFFGNLGIFSNMMPVMDTTTKGAKEKKKPEKKESQETASKTAEPTFKAPLTIIFDSVPQIEIEKEKEYKKSELFEEISNLTGISFFSEKKEQFTLNKLSDGKYHLKPGYSAKCEKGSAGKWLLLHGMQELGTLLEPNESGEITVDAVKAYIEENYGMNVNLYLVDEVYIPAACITKKNSLEGLTFPVKMTALTSIGEILELMREDYDMYDEEEKKEGEEEQMSLLPLDDKEAEPGKAKTSEKVSEVTLIKILKVFFPEFADDLEYNYIPEKNLIQVMHKAVAGAPGKDKKSVQKEETYPTDATISLVWTKIPISSDMFGGKKEITKKELIRYIGKTYPEYSQERTEITYDKKQNLIIPLLKSGKRGYSLEDTDVYRKEETELMNVCAFKDTAVTIKGCTRGTVKYNLPKIPFRILKEIMYFFWDVYVCRGSEAIAQIFYNKKEQEYEIYIPVQYACASAVEFDRDSRRENDPSMILVMEIHSHGSYSAFWSSTDNEEELAHRLYAVVGGIPEFRYDTDHIRVRAATGGYHVQVKPNEIFEFPKTVSEIHACMDKVRPYNQLNH